MNKKPLTSKQTLLTFFNMQKKNMWNRTKYKRGKKISLRKEKRCPDRNRDRKLAICKSESTNQSNKIEGRVQEDEIVKRLGTELRGRASWGAAHKAQFVGVSLASTKRGLTPHEIFTHSAPDTGLILVEAKSPVRSTALKTLRKCDTDKGWTENKHNKDTKGIISYIVNDQEWIRALL